MYFFNVFQSQAGLEKKMIRTCRLDPCPTIRYNKCKKKLTKYMFHKSVDLLHYNE